MTTSQDIRSAANAPRVAAPEQPAKAAATPTPRQPKAKPEPKACACQTPYENDDYRGCQDAKTNRVFAPGHDAKLVGYLTRQVIAGGMTQDAAVKVLDERSQGSKLLVAKLQTAIPRERERAATTQRNKEAREAAKAEKADKKAFAKAQAEAAKADAQAKREADAN